MWVIPDMLTIHIKLRVIMKCTHCMGPPINIVWPTLAIHGTKCYKQAGFINLLRTY